MDIVGAGFSGLIAAAAFPDSHIYEMNGPERSHNALLRFRSESVSHVLNIPFRKVVVHKGIYDTHKREFIAPNIAAANQYSQKSIARVSDRSIWDINSVVRYIAPDDVYEMLIDRFSDRIIFNVEYDILARRNEPIISTVPMNIVAAKINMHADFRRKSVHVRRYRITGCDVFQTIYFPCLDFYAYRASITGDTLIIESTDRSDDEEVEIILKAFGIHGRCIADLGASTQRYGKIASIDESVRRHIMRYLTDVYSVYSLGRFATWRNILLDDVVKDINVIKRMMESDEYDRALIRSEIE